jgi:hypothetical protein
MEIIKHTAPSLKDFVAIIDGLDFDQRVPMWFRGVGKTSHALVPSLYRHPTLRTTAELLDIESKMMTRFKERAVPYLNSYELKAWEYLFLMQHHGVPTRLLDWTENPFIALYFSLSSAIQFQRNEEPAAVWVLSPSLWNETVFQHLSYKGGPLSVTDRLITRYEPLAADILPEMPAAIFGIHNNPRIIAQRGVFTIFGSSIDPMENLVQNKMFPDGCLIKIEIPPDKIKTLLGRLFSTGYTESMIYPGLDGLALENKRIYGFIDLCSE